MEQEQAELERRRFLRLAAGGVLGVGTIGMPVLEAASQATRFPSGDPVTMAMHLHGSFSEGTASMDAHLHQAQRLGVDVLWWTDHDFRVGAFGYRQAVGFDGEEEPENGSAWMWVPRTTGSPASAGHAFVTTPLSPDEPVGRSLRFQATGSADNSEAEYLLEGKAWNLTYSTSYADTVLELDVLPERITAEAQIVVEIGSSYRPATAGRAAGQYRLQYRVGEKPGRWTEDNGRLGVIGISAGPSTSWQRLTLHLRADHAALWPDTVATDAALKQFRVGVRVRGGATAQCVVDRLRFLRSRRSTSDGMALLSAAVSEYRSRYPSITQHAASEVSLVKHLNAFGGDGALPTYAGTKASKNGTVGAQRLMVQFLQSHGACVSINHPHPGRNLSDTLVRTHGLGADVIEIGTHRRVESLARSFDVAARNAIFITASGVTDDHGGEDWLRQAGPRWITGAWARSRHQDDLGAAMKAGRAWFYDPLWWSGALDLLVDGYVPMGGVRFSSERSASITIKATQLPRGSSLDLVIGQCDRAGTGKLRPANRSIVVPARKVVRGRWSTDIAHRGGVYVRVMLRRHDGTIICFSNPVWVLPQRLSGTVRVPRDRHYRRV